MGWIPMYLTKGDIEILNDWLNQEPEIAFLIANGNKKWIAKNKHTILEDIESQNSDYSFVKYELWHVPSGPLPLFDRSDTEKKVINPFEGWTEIFTGRDSKVPYFGPGHPGVISLDIKLSHSGEIPISGFGWIGNHYRIIGSGSEKVTEKFWLKLRKGIKKMGTQIPRCNHLSGKNEICAFPIAYSKIEDGRACALNP